MEQIVPTQVLYSFRLKQGCCGHVKICLGARKIPVFLPASPKTEPPHFDLLHFPQLICLCLFTFNRTSAGNCFLIYLFDVVAISSPCWMLMRLSACRYSQRESRILLPLLAGDPWSLTNTCAWVLQEGNLKGSLVPVVNDVTEGDMLYQIILKFLAVAWSL